MLTFGLIWLSLLACEAPRFAPIAESLERYELGQAALTRGDAAAAAQAFTQAEAANPAAPELPLWLGVALAQEGRHEEAVSAATRALRLRPRWPLALYNRACWRLRGDPDEASLLAASEDLRLALASGALDPLAVAADPDLALLRAHPVLGAGVPAAALPFERSGSEEPLFLGATWEVTLRVAQGEGAPPALSLQGPARLPAKPIAALERIEPGAPVGWRELRVQLEVLGAGEGELGPWHADAGGLAGEAAPLGYRFLAPEGHDNQAFIELTEIFTWPSERLAALSDLDIQRSGETVLVKAAPGDRVEWGSPVSDAVRYELRRGDTSHWVGWSATLPKGTSVKVRRGSAVALDRTP